MTLLQSSVAGAGVGKLEHDMELEMVLDSCTAEKLQLWSWRAGSWCSRVGDGVRARAK